MASLDTESSTASLAYLVCPPSSSHLLSCTLLIPRCYLSVRSAIHFRSTLKLIGIFVNAPSYYLITNTLTTAVESLDL